MEWKGAAGRMGENLIKLYVFALVWVAFVVALRASSRISVNLPFYLVEKFSLIFFKKRKL